VIDLLHIKPLHKMAECSRVLLRHGIYLGLALDKLAVERSFQNGGVSAGMFFVNLECLFLWLGSDDEGGDFIGRSMCLVSRRELLRLRRI
jgi:hypothetical protein